MRRLSDIIYNQHPLTLRPSATVKDACRCMSEAHAGSVLVTDAHGRLAGIFTGRDAVCRVLAAGNLTDTVRARIVTALAALPAATTARDRVNTAILLVLTSPAAAIQK